MEKRPRQGYETIRASILNALAGSNMLSMNEISTKANLHWTTVRRHLVWLKGKGHVQNIYDHPRLKVYCLTEDGSKHIVNGIKNV